MSTSRLWAFLAVALPVFASLLAGLSSVDLAYQLRAGAEILESGAIPHADTWTFTAAGVPWLDQQWGAQVVLATVERLAGWTGLAVVRAALVGFVFGCLYLVGRRAGLTERVAALLSIAAFVVAAPALALRPQLLGMAMFALILLLVADRRTHPKRLWLAPIIVAAWANLHGSFFLGPLALSLAWLEDVHDGVPRPHRTLLLAVVSAGAACLTPFGPAVWLYAVGLSTNPEVTARITEWQPTSLRDVAGLLFFASVAAILVLIARRGRPVPWPTLAWLGVFFLLGTYTLRGIAWWSLGMVPAVGRLLSSPAAAGARARVDPPLVRRLNAGLVAALVLAAIALLPVWRPADPALGAPVGTLTHAPPGLTASLRDLVRPGDRVLNPQLWGSWFEYKMPAAAFAVDSRIEMFPPEVWDEHASVMAGAPGWQYQLERWGVTVIVTEAHDRGFAERLVADGWRVSYSDGDGSVLVRSDR